MPISCPMVVVNGRHLITVTRFRMHAENDVGCPALLKATVTFVEYDFAATHNLWTVDLTVEDIKRSQGGVFIFLGNVASGLSPELFNVIERSSWIWDTQLTEILVKDIETIQEVP